MSIFDEPKNYYVFKYVVDPVSEEPTEFAGEIQAFVTAKNPWEAVEKAGFTDFNKYGANVIDNLSDFENGIKEERKLLTKISKQLKEMINTEKSEREQFLKDRPCPNGCGKLDENFKCNKCGFGKEKEQLVKEIIKKIKEEKNKDNDTTELESFLDSVKEQIQD